MFDTKIYHNFGCKCLDCCEVGCRCEYHMGKTDFMASYQMLIEKQIYHKGFYDGEKEAFEEFEKEKIKFNSYSEQEKVVQILEDLIKKIKGRK